MPPHMEAVTAPVALNADKTRTVPGSSPCGPNACRIRMLGIQDVVSKSIGTQNPTNMIRATMDGAEKRYVLATLLLLSVAAKSSDILPSVRTM